MEKINEQNIIEKMSRQLSWRMSWKVKRKSRIGLKQTTKARNYLQKKVDQASKEAETAGENIQKYLDIMKEERESIENKYRDMLKSEDPAIADQARVNIKNFLENSSKFKEAQRNHDFFASTLKIHRQRFELLEEHVKKIDEHNILLASREGRPQEIRNEFLFALEESKARHLAEFNALDRDSFTPEQLQAKKDEMDQKVREEAHKLFIIKKTNLEAIGATLTNDERDIDYYYDKTTKHLDHEYTEQEKEQQTQGQQEHSEKKDQKQEKEQEQQEHSETNNTDPDKDMDSIKREQAIWELKQFPNIGEATAVYYVDTHHIDSAERFQRFWQDANAPELTADQPFKALNNKEKIKESLEACKQFLAAKKQITLIFEKELKTHQKEIEEQAKKHHREQEKLIKTQQQEQEKLSKDQEKWRAQYQKTNKNHFRPQIEDDLER